MPNYCYRDNCRVPLNPDYTCERGHCQCQDCQDTWYNHEPDEDAEGNSSNGVFVTNRLTFHPTKRRKNGFVANPSRRFISCEIEVAHVKSGNYTAIKDVANRWRASIVSDGSLCNYEDGFEINTAPANGAKFLEEIKDFTAVLGENEALVDANCGMHVHVDARDINWGDLMKVLHVYSLAEGVIFGLLAPSRMHNSYCIPCGRKYTAYVQQYRRATNPSTYPPTAKTWKREMLRSLYGDSDIRGPRCREFARIKRTKYMDVARKQALNIHTYFYRKTIEFRHHHGTLNFDKITNWAMLCASLVDFAVAQSWDALMNMPPMIRPSDLAIFPITQATHAWVQARWAKFHRPTPSILDNPPVPAEPEIRGEI